MVLEVFTAGGRRVRTVRDRVTAPGPRHLTWDGRSESGAEMPRGVYFYRISSGSLRGHGKLVLAR
jgi:hypothetical protein